MLHNVEERLRRQKASQEREEKIAAEFDDSFITQVYNYLSLGYPAMARAYDGELARISHMSHDDIELDDARQMAKGHMTEETRDAIPEEQRCPIAQVCLTVTQVLYDHFQIDTSSASPRSSEALNAQLQSNRDKVIQPLLLCITFVSKLKVAASC